MRSEVLSFVVVRNVILWVMAPCSFVCGYQYLLETYCLHFQGKFSWKLPLNLVRPLNAWKPTSNFARLSGKHVNVRSWGTHPSYKMPLHLIQAVPVTGRGGLKGYEMLRIPHCLDNRLTVNCEILATFSSTYGPVRTSQEGHSVSIK
jgi:hypothetical protein